MRRLATVTAALVFTAACANTNIRAPSPDTGGGSDSTRDDDERKLARSVGLQVEREEPREGPPAAIELAKLHGGWVQSAAPEQVVVQLPEARLDEFLLASARLGQITRRDQAAQEVSAQFHDLRIRIDNLEKQRTRLLELYQRAGSIAEMLAVERELERVTLHLEQLKGRAQLLEKSIAFAAVDIRFARPMKPGPIGWVFYGAFRAAKWLFVWD